MERDARLEKALLLLARPKNKAVLRALGLLRGAFMPEFRPDPMLSVFPDYLDGYRQGVAIAKSTGCSLLGEEFHED